MLLDLIHFILKKFMFIKLEQHFMKWVEARRRKKVIKFLLFDLYNQYLRFKSSLEFYQTTNAELIESGIDDKRLELEKLRKEPIKSDGLSKEQLQKANLEAGVRVHQLNSEIEYYERVIADMEKAKRNANETMYHYKSLSNLLSAGYYKEAPKKIL